MKVFITFLGVSLSIHAAALLTLPEGGVDGQGASGEDAISLVASAANMSSLADTWDQPPEVAPQPVLSAPAAHTEIATPISAETAVQTPNAPSMTTPSIGAAPTAETAPLPAPNLGAIPNVPTPSLSLPSLPGGVGPAPSNASDVVPRSTPQPFSPPQAITAPPRPDVTPHFEGSTARATDTSPRPAERPNDLAPPPAPSAPVATPRAPAAQPAPQPSAPAAPDRTAAGTSGGETQGAAPTPTPQPGLSPGQIQSLVSQWGGQIQARIARSGPNVNGTGRAVVRLSVAPDGRLVALGIAQSSGNPAVDQAAINAVQRAGRFPRAPGGLTDASYSFSVPLTFR